MRVVLTDEMAIEGWLAALPVVGRDSTLPRWFVSPETAHKQARIRAKTGTLTAPREAVGLAGYSRLRGGEWVAFAILVNGPPHPCWGWHVSGMSSRRR